MKNIFLWLLSLFGKNSIKQKVSYKEGSYVIKTTLLDSNGWPLAILETVTSNSESIDSIKRIEYEKVSEIMVVLEKNNK